MKRLTYLFLITIIAFSLSVPVVGATIKYPDGFIWYYYTTDDFVHSEYNNDQPHSASVSAKNYPTYRNQTDQAYKVVGVTLHTGNSGKKAYYNYW